MCFPGLFEVNNFDLEFVVKKRILIYFLQFYTQKSKDFGKQINKYESKKRESSLFFPKTVNSNSPCYLQLIGE